MASLLDYTAAPAQPSPYANAPDPNAMVQSSLEAMLNPNSSYIQNARQRGVEYAAERGGLNSSIAAGASERSALEAAQPLVNAALNIQNTRDVLAGQNWLDTQKFNREFQGQIAMMPVTNSYNMLNMVMQQSLSDPALYGPDVISGYSNFFKNNMNDIMKQYTGGDS
jgi:hypothetical protein